MMILADSPHCPFCGNRMVLEDKNCFYVGCKYCEYGNERTVGTQPQYLAEHHARMLVRMELTKRMLVLYNAGYSMERSRLKVEEYYTYLGEHPVKW